MQSLLCFSALNPKTRSETRFRLRVHFDLDFIQSAGQPTWWERFSEDAHRSPLVAWSFSDGVIRVVEMNARQMLVSVPMLGSRLCVL